METTRILITGVGGQGTKLASRILGSLAMQLGCDVKVSEVHGMAQRGGSVVTYVVMGEKVASPLIEAGEADFLFSFEELEALRYLNMVKKGGTIVVNAQRIAPMPVITGAAQYPENPIKTMKDEGFKVVAVDALALALEAGNAKATNTALMGALAREMDLREEDVLTTLEKVVKPQTVEVNKAAFRLGYKG